MKSVGFVIRGKNRVFNNVFGLAAVPDDASCNGEHKASVSAKENLQGTGIIGLQTSHHLLIARRTVSSSFRRRDSEFLALSPAPSDGKCERASLRRRTHAWLSIPRHNAAHSARHPVHRRIPPGKLRCFSKPTPLRGQMRRL